MDYKEQIEKLIQNPEDLIKITPFTRGMDNIHSYNMGNKSINVGETITATLPDYKRKVVTQKQLYMEFDPDCHKILFDDNVPSITMKIKDRYVEIEYKKMAIPFQLMIKNAHLLHLCGNPMQFTMMDSSPTKQQVSDFATFKQYWIKRNQDGMRTKMVDAQMSIGSAALLYYFNRYGEIKSRLFSYLDGYILSPHNDENGDRLLDSIYYAKDGIEYIDSYDDTYHYLHVKDNNSGKHNGWILQKQERHGFEEIPLVTKRGDVPWTPVQSTIEAYEVMYNIFLVIQKRHGWGILYVKGRFSDEGKRIAGAILLNDTSIDGTGSAEFKAPPTPQGMIDTLKEMEKTIQRGSGTTFILPEDIRMSGDVSGLAFQIAQSLDHETSKRNVIKWQNVADKMGRLFKYGLAKELVKKDEQPMAISNFKNLNIFAQFKEWKPRSDESYNQMLSMLKGSGLISQQTGIQKNTESTPDEELRIAEETSKNVMQKKQNN